MSNRPKYFVEYFDRSFHRHHAETIQDSLVRVKHTARGVCEAIGNWNAYRIHYVPDNGLPMRLVDHAEKPFQ